MLGFFEEHDELYWNVTGFDWAFPIDKASATVELEFDAPLSGITDEAYTGPFGATGRDYRSRIDSAAAGLLSRRTSPCPPVNGLTIVVGWPKGFVAEPTQAAIAPAGCCKDNKNLLARRYRVLPAAGLLHSGVAKVRQGSGRGRDRHALRAARRVFAGIAALHSADVLRRQGHDGRRRQPRGQRLPET